MWRRSIRGLTLTFHLAGINNQNFLMRDEQTGTYWQQISGRAVSGPLAGAQLDLVYSDELTFDLWRKLAPEGTVLLPVSGYAGRYETKDWDVRMAKVRTVLDFPNTPLQSRDLILGVRIGQDSRAYPVARILQAKLIEDRLGGEPILLMTGPDAKSIRVFRARLSGGETPEFYRKTDVSGAVFMDSESGSEWNFDGCAATGRYSGQCLALIPAVKDYWFDWRNYHPDTTVFGR